MACSEESANTTDAESKRTNARNINGKFSEKGGRRDMDGLWSLSVNRCFDSTGECSRRSALQAGLGTALALPAFAAGDIPDQDTVLLDEERQIIDNFGASDAWSMQKIGG